MKPLLHTIRELLAVTHRAHVELCVRFNEWNVERAKADLAAALDARDRARAAERIAAHTEQQPVPLYLVRKAES